MTKKISSLEEAPIDVVEAVKRGVRYRGFIPRRFVRQGISKADISSAQSSAEPEPAPAPSANSQKTAISGKGVSNANPQPNTQEASQNPSEQEPGEVHEKLIDVTEKAHDVLFEAETVFPFTLFPDTITLDKEKLSVASRQFFRVARIITVPLTSLISAEANVGPFFGSVQMTSKYFVNSSHSINFLKRDDATQIHRLLQGFIIAQEKGIDVSDIETEDLKVLLHDLGQGVSD